MTATYSSIRTKLNPQGKEQLQKDELAWIAYKDGLAAQEKLSAIQNRIKSLQQQYGKSGEQSEAQLHIGDQNLVQQIDAAENRLAALYTSLRNRLDSQQRDNLKKEELKWISWKDSLPLSQKLSAVQDRIQSLRQHYGQ